MAGLRGLLQAAGSCSVLVSNTAALNVFNLQANDRRFPLNRNYYYSVKQLVDNMRQDTRNSQRLLGGETRLVIRQLTRRYAEGMQMVQSVEHKLFCYDVGF